MVWRRCRTPAERRAGGHAGRDADPSRRFAHWGLPRSEGAWSRTGDGLVLWQGLPFSKACSGAVNLLSPLHVNASRGARSAIAGHFPKRGRGGTGRRAALRALWAKARGGSIPLDRTTHACACSFQPAGRGGGAPGLVPPPPFPPFLRPLTIRFLQPTRWWARRFARHGLTIRGQGMRRPACRSNSEHCHGNRTC